MMKQAKLKLKVILTGILCFMCLIVYPDTKQDFFEKALKDYWGCIKWMTTNHLPWSWKSDTLYGGDYCNTAEIGNLMLCWICAFEMKKSWSPSKKETDDELLAILKQLRDWQTEAQNAPNGDNSYMIQVFKQWYWISWNPPVVGSNAGTNQVVPSIDNAWLASALVIVRQYALFYENQQIADKAKDILDDMDFTLWYDSEKKGFYWGGVLNPQAGGVDLVCGNESRLTSYMAYSLGHISEAQYHECLNAMQKPALSYDGITVHRTGYDGSLFTYLSLQACIIQGGDFLRNTIVPAIQAQIKYALNKGHQYMGLTDVYGVESNGYRSQGAPPAIKNINELEERPGLVALHALFMALLSTEEQSGQAITDLMNLKSQFPESYVQNRGFRASINVNPASADYGKYSFRYCFLDQSWSFIFMCQNLKGILWKYAYQSEKHVTAHNKTGFYGQFSKKEHSPFTQTLINEISMAQFANSNSVDVEISLNRGTATLIKTEGLTFTTGDGTADADMQYSGSVTDLTASFKEGFFFTPNDVYQGYSSSFVSISDKDDPTNNADFTILIYDKCLTVKFIAGEHGTISGTAVQRPTVGADCSPVEAVADEYYHFTSWSDENTDNPRAISNVTDDLTLTANFAVNTYDIVFSTDSNGTIEGNANQTVTYNSSTESVRAVPNTGCYFVNWKVDEIVYTSANPLVLNEISSDMVLTATFAKNRYSVSFKTDGNGSLKGNTNQSVFYGDDCTAVTASNKTGWHFVSWTLDNSVHSTDNPLALTKISSNMELTANFEKIVCTLTYTAGTGGKIEGVSPQTVSYGSDGTEVTAVPNEGYSFIRWDDSVGTASRTDREITGDLNVKAIFELQNFSISGTVSGEIAAGVTMTLTGSNTVTTVTDPEGKYSFTGLVNGNYTLTPSLTVYDFEPTLLEITVSGSDVTGQNFISSADKITLTLSISPTDYGATTPSPGEHEVLKDNIVAIEAIPENDSHFLTWTTTAGDVEFENVFSASTNITVQANSAITAHFGETPLQKVTLTILCDPQDGGTTDPAGPTLVLAKGIAYDFEAQPGPGHSFITYIPDKNCLVLSPNTADTKVLLSDNASLMVLFSSSGLPAANMTVNHFKIVMGNTPVDSDSVSIKIKIPNDFSFTPETDSFKLLLGQWNITIPAASQWENKNTNLFFTGTVDAGTATCSINYSKSIIILKVKNASLLGKINSGGTINIYMATNDIYFTEEINPEEKTKWKSTSAGESLKGFSSGVDKFSGEFKYSKAKKNNYRFTLKGSNLEDPTTGFNQTLVPTVFIDNQKWYFDQPAQVKKENQYTYQIPESSLKLDFSKKNWTFRTKIKEALSNCDVSRSDTKQIILKFENENSQSWSSTTSVPVKLKSTLKMRKKR